MWGRFEGKSDYNREASWLGGFEEQGGFQHVEMEVDFWAGEKSMKKDTEKQKYTVISGPAGMDLVTESPLRELYWGKA